jgi:Holliday junction resolvase RusA-like endonuclease
MAATLLDTEPQTAEVLSFFVAGHPETAGSKTAVPIVKDGERVATRVVESGDRAKKATWRSEIQASAREAMEAAGWSLTTEPVQLVFTFYRVRPKGHYGSGKNERELKASSPAYPTTKPDALKLARAAEDALTGVVWADDAQVVDGRQVKRFADRFTGREGVAVAVRRIPAL